MDMEFFMRDVRCFNEQHKFRIRPLTFLVGENSTGKSTVLGCMQALNRAFCQDEVDFNVEPFQMGTFANIVRKSRPLNEAFQLGLEIKGSAINEASRCFIRFTERQEGQEPVISTVEWRIGNKKIVCNMKRNSGQKGSDEISTKLNAKKDELQVDVPLRQRRYSVYRFLDLNYILHYISLSLDKDKQSNKELQDWVKGFDWLKDVDWRKEGFGWLKGLDWQKAQNMHRMNVQSIAPIRSKPRRTYNPLRQTEDPEGSEIPTRMMNLSRVNKKRWERMQEKLSRFGQASGLFSSVEVRKLGKSSNDPFQLQVAARGKAKMNLIDVGYGVSQILPVLMRVFQKRGTRFLLQQPEVHLHPKGQAEFSSLLVQNIKDNRNAFMVETHSDYMIDRARIEIRKGKIAPEDVSLIYFEPKKLGNSVVSHNIEFDDQGNMQNVPEGYRDFFLNETDKLLGFQD